MKTHMQAHKLLRLRTPLADYSNSLVKKFKIIPDPNPKKFPQPPHPSVLQSSHIKTHFDYFKSIQPQVTFTEGSAQNHGSGSGYTSFKASATDPLLAIHIAIPKNTTNFAAEIVAISEPLQWTLKHQKGDTSSPPAPNTTDL